MTHHADPIQARIVELKRQRDAQWQTLRESVGQQMDQFRPGRIIQNALADINTHTDTQSEILQAGVHMAAASIARGIVGKSKNKPLKKWLQVVLVYALSALVVRYKDQIIEAGSHWLDHLKARFQQESGPASGDVPEGQNITTEESK